MSFDLILTWPKTRSLADYLRECEKAEEKFQLLNFRVSSHPRRTAPGRRCYMVHDGALRGWMTIESISDRSENEVIDPYTGDYWPAGIYIVRYPAWHAIPPEPMAGFRGFRYRDPLARRMFAPRCGVR